MEDGVWPAINELREKVAANRARIAVTENKIESVDSDIDGVGEKVANLHSDCATKADVQRLADRMEAWSRTMRWTVGLMVPAVSALIGALIQGGG